MDKTSQLKINANLSATIDFGNLEIVLVPSPSDPVTNAEDARDNLDVFKFSVGVCGCCEEGSNSKWDESKVTTVKVSLITLVNFLSKMSDYLYSNVYKGFKNTFF